MLLTVAYDVLPFTTNLLLMELRWLLKVLIILLLTAFIKGFSFVLCSSPYNWSSIFYRVAMNIYFYWLSSLNTSDSFSYEKVIFLRFFRLWEFLPPNKLPRDSPLLIPAISLISSSFVLLRVLWFYLKIDNLLGLTIYAFLTLVKC